MKIASHDGDIGKYKILLDQVSSTQWYALELLRSGTADHGTMITCLHQIQGRGRLDKSWQSEKLQNLAISFILKNFTPLKKVTAGYLSMMTALAVCHTLKISLGNEVKIKWPNDIICSSRKVAGILITNQWRGNLMESSVLGIGINVNQIDFPDIPQAGSIKSISGKHQTIDKISQNLVDQLNHWYHILIKNVDDVHSAYHLELYGYMVPIEMKLSRDELTFNAIILGVDEDGKVNIQFEDQTVRSFDLDELKIIFR